MKSLGLHHSDFGDGEIFDELPYYGCVLRGSMMNEHLDADEIKDGVEYKYGKIGNPTVHVALNQIRRVVNALIKRYGAPDEIHIEVGRELKQSRQHRSDVNKMIATNERDNDKRRKLCEEQGVSEPSALDIKKVKLWEELNSNKFARECVFSGQTISANMLFNGDVEIEHILPFSQTKDNSNANLTLAIRQANRIKKDRSPYDARLDFETQGWAWDEIVRRAQSLRKSKRDRFAEDAMDHWLENNHFLDRQLTDNSYISRLASQYLGVICGANHVVCVSGQLSGLLRGKWRLSGLLSLDGKKNRDDHRHHGVDALVVGLTTRSIIQGVNTRRTDDGRIHFDVPDLPEGLYAQARELFSKIIISVKPEHGENGKFFKETAYGFVAMTGAAVMSRGKLFLRLRSITLLRVRR